jgi:hypothetical protein
VTIKKSSSERAYLVLGIKSRDQQNAIKSLSKQPGVTAVDAVDGSGDVITVLEAPSREVLAAAVNAALLAVEKQVSWVDLIPVKARVKSAVLSK